VFYVIDPENESKFWICLDDEIKTSTRRNLNLRKDDVFVCRDIAIDDTSAANLALTCRLKTI
jgi:adenine-specific DNA-methyltransferase